jgi:hypothetical protein
MCSLNNGPVSKSGSIHPRSWCCQGFSTDSARASCASSATEPSFYGTNNQLLLEALNAHPERLRGTAIVSPDIEAEELAQLAQSGIVGIRLDWVRRKNLPDVASAEYRTFFRIVRAWHVEVFLESGKLAHVLPRIRESGAKVVLDRRAPRALGRYVTNFRSRAPKSWRGRKDYDRRHTAQYRS